MQSKSPALELLGLTAVKIAEAKLSAFQENDTEGMIRFDSFDSDLLCACFNALARSSMVVPDCYDGLELRLSDTLVEHPEEIEVPSILTPLTPAAIRNAKNTCRLKLFANGSDDITRDTLSDVTAIKEPDLINDTQSLIAALMLKYPQLVQTELTGQLQEMFSSLTKNMARSVLILSEFLLAVTDDVVAGSPINTAVNDHLRLLGFPRYKDAMPSDPTDPKGWKNCFEAINEIPTNLFAGDSRPYDVRLDTLSDNLAALQNDDCPASTLDIYQSIVNNDGRHNWGELIELDWEEDCLKQFLTTTVGKTKSAGIAEATLTCLHLHDCELLNKTLPVSGKSVEDFLNHFGNPKKLEGEALAEARRFYGEVGHAISEHDAKLDRRWDKLLFSETIEGEDFIEDILRASTLLAQRVNSALMQDPVLLLRCRTNSRKLVNITNRYLVNYFSLLYRGLETQCADFVDVRFKSFDFKSTGGLNPLFHFEEVIETLRSKADKGRKTKKAPKAASLSKDALSLEFDAFLVNRTDLDDGLAQSKAVRIRWQLPKTNIALSLARDWRHLTRKEKNPKPAAYEVIFARNFKQSNTKGLISEITLDDASSFGLTSSCFIDKNRRNKSLTNLKEKFEALLAEEPAGIDIASIRTAWEKFDASYLTALADVERVGLGANSIVDMHAAYGDLLKAVSRNAEKSQDFRQRSISYLLSIGIYSFIDKNSAYAVAAPWQPLRLYELHRAFVTRMNLVKLNVTGAASIGSGFEILKRLHDQKSEFEPTFVVVPTESDVTVKKHCTEILAPIQYASGYTLYSRIAGPESRDSGTSDAAAKELAEIVSIGYPSLVPQASNAINVILPDVVSKQFPTVFVNEMIDKLADYQKLSVKVGGLNAHRYQAANEELLYQGLTVESARSQSVEEIAVSSASMKSSVNVSVSRVRDNVLASNSLVKEGINPYDIAFINRFFTYSAKNNWVPLPRRCDDPDPYNLNTSLQLRSRRLVQLENEFTSTTLLCADAVNDVGHAYINATSWLLRNKSADHGTEFEYPCLQVDCNDVGVSNVIQTLHKLANWVVTINDFIDRRQLINNDIKIVRYKTNAKTGKTSIISSEMPTAILSHRIAEQVASLGDRTLRNRSAAIANRILEASYRISGYLALRAARLNTGANEITGLVLSNWFAQNALISQARQTGEEVLAAASFLVDDYATIFKNDKRLADLLCLVLAKQGNRCCLHLAVTESKFVTAATRDENGKKSALQTAATYNVLRRALADSPEAQAERPIWLARLADFVTSLSKNDLIEPTLSSKDLIRFADAVKTGDFDLTLAGASHVFAYDWEKELDIDELPVSAENKIAQIFFGASATEQSLKTFAGDDPTPMVAEVLSHNLLKPIALVQPWDYAHRMNLENLGEFASNTASMTYADEPEDVEEDEPETQTQLENESPDGLKFARDLVTPVESKVPGVELRREIQAPTVKSSELSLQTPAESIDSRSLAEVVPVAAPVDATGSRDAPSTALPAQTPSDINHQTFSPVFAKLVLRKASDTQYSPEREAWAKEATKALQMALVEKGMQAKIQSYSLTPNGCLVRFVGSSNLESKRVLALKEMLLTTRSINLVLVQPQRGSLVVLFNDGSDNRETVSMWNIWKHRKVEKRLAGVNLSFVVGLKETDGEILYFNPIEQDPHTLIAGRTGSGKTVLMQTMILDMAATNPSTKLKFYIIDPKGGNDYFPLLRLPHLAAPLIRDPEQAVLLLKELVAEMHRRNQLFGELFVNKLDRYNAKVPPDKQLPVIFLIHDELPQWMANKDYRQTVTETLTQLATMSRASGIYLIFLAQRPDKDVMSMQIRTNLGNRLVLKLDAASSEIALEDKGAENLLGKGHLAAKLGGTIYYAQAPYLDEDKGEIEEAVDAIIEGDKDWIISTTASTNISGTKTSDNSSIILQCSTIAKLPSSAMNAKLGILSNENIIKESNNRIKNNNIEVNKSRKRLSRSKIVSLDSIELNKYDSLQPQRLDLQTYLLVRSKDKNLESSMNFPIWCLALSSDRSYQFWWHRIGTESATHSPAGDRQYILGLIGLGASVRYRELTGQNKPGDSAFVAKLQLDFVVDGVSVLHLTERRQQNQMPTEAQIREKARQIEAFIAKEKENPESPYLRPNAIGRLKEISESINRRYTVKI